MTGEPVTGRSDGFYAEKAGIRRRAQDFADEHGYVEKLRAELEQTFLREGQPLGDDQYGAELEKNLPKIKDSISDGFKAYADELESVRGRLIASVEGYQTADQASAFPGV